MFSIVAVPIYNSISCAWGFHFLHSLTSTYFLSSCWEPFWQVCEVKVVQSCPTLCDPMDCNAPGTSVRGILQARILQWVTIPFFRGSLNPHLLHCKQILYCLSHQGSLVFSSNARFFWMKRKQMWRKDHDSQVNRWPVFINTTDSVSCCAQPQASARRGT